MNEASHSSSEGRVDNLSSLAKLAKEGETKEERDRAFEQLIEPITKIAAKVVAKYLSTKSFIGIDFIGGSPSLIWERLGHYDAERPFEPWCAKLLKNAFIDQSKRNSRQKPVSDLVDYSKEEGMQRYQSLLASVEVPWQSSNLREEDFFEKPFFGRDITLLETELTAKARITCLVVGGLWRKVPSEIWEKWLDDGGYPRGFPPDEIFRLEDIQERVTAVAEYLGEARQTIYMRWNRSLLVLRRLTVFRQDTT